ncbi:MAG: Ig-like domain-containing protein [Planctomycetes bacterium]|nr:Ig-like domain-containing protein [Planctomycetota bacterium]
MHRLALTLLLVFLAAFALRWWGIDHTWLHHFSPEPDALEYAALAHDIADRGEMLLQLGDHRLLSRYPPGWPLLLAGAVRCGLRGEAVTGVVAPISALHAVWIAVLAWVVWRNVFDRERRRPGAGLLAAAVAGLGWSAAPISLHAAARLMSDEPGALFSNAGLLWLAIGAVSSRPRAGWAAAAGGLCLATAVAIRPNYAHLAAVPLLLLWCASAVRHGARFAAWRGACAVLGGLPLLLGVCWLMLRSGTEPWRWSQYEFWSPELYDDFWGRVLNLTFAFHGSPDAPLHSHVQMPHLEVAGRVFAGFCFDERSFYSTGLGYCWPAAAWLVGGVFAFRTWRVARGGWLVAALAAWLGGHVALYSVYYHPDERYFVGVLPWAWVVVGSVVARLARTGVGCACAAGLLLLIAALVGPGVAAQLRHRGPPVPDLANTSTVRRFAAWIELPVEQRGAATMPFDPVRAQALGLFTPAARARIAGGFGAIAANVQQRAVLVHHRLIPELAEQLPVVERIAEQPLRVPHAVERAGFGRLWRDSRCYHIEITGEDPSSDVREPEQHYTIDIVDLSHGVLRIRGVGMSLTARGTSGLSVLHRLNRYLGAVVCTVGDLPVVVRVAGGSLEVLAAQGIALHAEVAGTPIRLPGFGNLGVFRDGAVFRTALRSTVQAGEVHYLTATRGRLDACLPVIDRGSSPFRVRAGLPELPPGERVAAAELWRLTDPRLGRAVVLCAEPDRLLAPGPALRLLVPRVAAWESPPLPAGAAGARPLAAALACGQRPVLLDGGALPPPMLELVRAAQRTVCRTVRYADAEGVMVELEQALVRGLDLVAPRIEVAYRDGLLVYANLGAADWHAPTPRGAEHLPPGSFLGILPNGRRVRTAGADAAVDPDVASARLRIVGDERLFPGCSATALRVLADRGTQSVDVTHRVTWTSDHPSVVQVDAAGVAQARAVGRALIRARLGAQQGDHWMQAVELPSLTAPRLAVQRDDEVVFTYSCAMPLRPAYALVRAKGDRVWTQLFAEPTPLRHGYAVRATNLLPGADYEVWVGGELAAGGHPLRAEPVVLRTR